MQIPWPGLFRSVKSVALNHRHIAHFENVLGTSLELQIISSEETSGRHAEAAILAEIDRLEAIFNAYNPQSELSLWQRTFDQEVQVSDELAHVLLVAEQWRQETQGAFNPATEALTRIWKAAEHENRSVSREEVEGIVAQISGLLWEVNSKTQTATRRTNLPVTLNSIAKGFIVDRATEIGGSIEGVQQIVVNIGGDIRHRGDRAAPIAIADPYSDAENAVPLARISICNQGVATSGNYRRGFSVNNRWFSHLIDPRTGWPVEKSVGVSVVAPDAQTADVLATALSVLPPAESLALADSLPHIGVLLVTQQGQKLSNAWWESQKRL